MAEIDWSKPVYENSIGEKIDIKTMSERIGDECYAEPIRRGFTPQAEELRKTAACVREGRAAAQKTIDQSEVNSVLSSLPRVLITAAKNGDQKVGIAVFDKPEIPKSYAPVIEVLQKKGYETNLISGTTREPIKPGERMPGLQIYVLEASMEKKK